MKHAAQRLVFRTKSLIGYALQARSHLYVHAPFAYHLCTDVLYERKKHDAYTTLAALRNEQRRDKTTITFKPAGTSVHYKIAADVSGIARRYALPLKHAKLLYRLVRYLKPDVILETGTGTGFSSAALALGNTNASVHTIDAVPELTDVSKRYHQKHHIRNIEYHLGQLDHVLADTAKKIAPIQFVYLDANHTHDATLKYFNTLLPHLSSNACVVVDDIHWSSGMKKAWIELTKHPSVTLSIDLFRVGLLFTDPSLNREALRIYF